MIITDIGIFYNNIIKLYMSGTAHNRIVNASLRSLPRLTPPQFISPGLASQALIRAGKPSFTTWNVIRNLG